MSNNEPCEYCDDSNYVDFGEDIGCYPCKSCKPSMTEAGPEIQTHIDQWRLDHEWVSDEGANPTTVLHCISNPWAIFIKRDELWRLTNQRDLPSGTIITITTEFELSEDV